MTKEEILSPISKHYGLTKRAEERFLGAMEQYAEQEVKSNSTALISQIFQWFEIKHLDPKKAKLKEIKDALNAPMFLYKTNKP